LKRIKILDRNGAGFGEKPQPKKTRHSILRRDVEQAAGIIRWREKKVVSLKSRGEKMESGKRKMGRQTERSKSSRLKS